MPPTADAEYFNFRLHDLDWREYWLNYFVVLRTHYFKVYILKLEQHHKRSFIFLCAEEIIDLRSTVVWNFQFLYTVQAGDGGGEQAATRQDEVRLQGGQRRLCIRMLGIGRQLDFGIIVRDEKFVTINFG